MFSAQHLIRPSPPGTADAPSAPSSSSSLSDHENIIVADALSRSASPTAGDGNSSDIRSAQKAVTEEVLDGPPFDLTAKIALALIVFQAVRCVYSWF